MNYFFKFGDTVIYLVLLAAALFPLFVAANSRPASSYIELSAGRRQTFLLPRQIDSLYSFTGFQIQVLSGRCRILNSRCSDHLCERYGWLDSGSNGRIICLPQKTVIKNKFNMTGVIDEISQ